MQAEPTTTFSPLSKSGYIATDTAFKLAKSIDFTTVATTTIHLALVLACITASSQSMADIQPASQPRIRNDCRGPANSIALADGLLSNRYTFPPHPTVTLPSDPTWTENPLGDDNWQAQYHGLVWTKSLTTAWDMTGDRRYLDRASFLLRDWHRDNPRNAPASTWSWSDSTGWRALVYACAAEILPSSSWLTNALIEHGKALADPRFYKGVSNHDLFKNQGLLEVGCSLGRTDWIALAADRTNALIGVGVDSQGGNNEQAVFYAYYNYSLYQSIRQRMAECGQRANSLFSRLDKIPEFLAHATLPDGSYALLGDTGGGRALVIRGTPAEFASTQGRSGPRPAGTAAIYTGAGFGFVRTGWGESRPFADEAMLTVRFGLARRMHGHHDGSSITFYAYGVPLLLDSGKYSYNRSAYRDYFVSRMAHNLVTVDDAQFDPKAMTSLAGRHSSSTMWELSMSSKPYAGVTATRRVTFSRKLGYVVGDDRLKGTAPHHYRQLWHLKEDSKPTVKGIRTWTNRRRGNVLIMQLRAPALTRITTGATSPIQGWVSYLYNKKLPAPVVEAQLDGQSVQFLTLLVPYAKNRPVVRVVDLRITNTGYTMTVRVDGRSERLVMDGSTIGIYPAS